MNSHQPEPTPLQLLQSAVSRAMASSTPASAPAAPSRSRVLAGLQEAPAVEASGSAPKNAFKSAGCVEEGPEKLDSALMLGTMSSLQQF